MNGLIQTLLEAETSRPLFLRDEAPVTAGEVRRLAAGLLPRITDAGDTLFLSVASAAHLTASLLAAAASGRAIAMPAHAQAEYLAEIGCPPEALITDAAFEGLTDGDIAALGAADLDPSLDFFTSGSSGAPKRVRKNLSRLEIEARALDGLWGREAGRVIATVSHQHFYGFLFRVVWPVMTARVSDDAPAVYWENLEGRFEGATLVSTPAHLTRLSPRAELYAPHPDLIFSSGQLLPTDAAQACIGVFGRAVTEVLGSTETGGLAWRRQTAPETLWTPFPDVSITTDEAQALIVRSPYLQDGGTEQTGDIIALQPDGRFQLKPRGDRIVKIDGKRVSLARVEEALGRLPEIAAAATLALPDLKGALGAVVELTPAGQALLDEEGRFRLSRRLRAAIAPVLESAERPKYWRFVDRIETNSQGKRVLSVLAALFSASDGEGTPQARHGPAASPLDALALEIEQTSETTARIAFTLTPELIYFDGHFPEQPILPGVSQVHLAALLAERLWGVAPSSANISRLKFRRVLAPGDPVVLQLRRYPASGGVSFVFQTNGAPASQGDIGDVR